MNNGALLHGLASNLDSRETSPPGPLPIDGEGEESVPPRTWVGVRFPSEVGREAIVEVRREAISGATSRARHIRRSSMNPESWMVFYGLVR